MHSFSTGHDNHFSNLTICQEEFHTGRLLCWSGALVAITLWGSAQFLSQQNSQWQNQNGMEQRFALQQKDADRLPETAAIVQRIAARYPQYKTQTR